MKFLHLNFFIVLLMCNCYAQPKTIKKIKTMTYLSPIEYNHAIHKDQSIKSDPILIFQKPIDNDRSDVIFINESGKVITSISISLHHRFQWANIDKIANEVFICTPIFFNDKRPENGTKHYITDVYNVEGQLKLRFQDNFATLAPFSAKYYITVYPDPEDSGDGPTYLVDDAGNKIRLLNEQGVFTIWHRDDHRILAWKGNRLSAYNPMAELQFEKELQFEGFVRMNPSVSDSGQICFTTTKSNIYVTDRNADIIKIIPAKKFIGSVRAQISHDGRFLLWANSSRTMGERIKNRNSQIVLYDLSNDTIVWEKALLAEASKSWSPKQMGFSNEGDLTFVNFHDGDLLLFNQVGRQIFSTNLKSPSVDFVFSFLQHRLIAYNRKSNEITIFKLIEE